MDKYLPLFLILLSGILYSCSEDDPGTEVDTFDRNAMLTNWADNIILPAYANYVDDLVAMNQDLQAFASSPNPQTLTQARAGWLTAYISWQSVSMFEIGPAERVTLRDFSNIFPTNSDLIESHIATGGYNLELPSTRVAQGFPALDYLLFGIAESDDNIIARYNSEGSLVTYLTDLGNRLVSLGTEVHSEWFDGYRDTFIENDGSSASSSVNKLVNDFMFYYEKALRAGKIGIPAGVFSNSPLSDRVEGLYSREHSRDLFLASLEASKDFFNGVRFGSSTQNESLKTYLDFLNTVSNGERLSNAINNQFDAALSQGNQLDNDLFQEVESNNVVMLQTYDELQKNVILLKVDMFQALSIQVDFVDADGD